MVGERKNKTIPSIPKEDRIRFEYGYHNLPDWVSVLLVVMTFIVILSYHLT